jgi:transcriptional regulator with XRE-family HTH domain
LDNLLQIEQGARFSKVLKRLRLTQTTVSQLTGLSQPLISQICSGHREITRPTERAIAEKLQDVNMDWVITGKGPMFFSDEPENKSQVLVEEGRVEYAVDPLSALRLLLENHERRLLELERIVEEMQVVPAGEEESPTLKE